MKQVFFAFVVGLLLTWNTSAVAEEGNDTDDAFYNGVTAYRAYQFEEAAHWFLKAAEQGDAEAQFLLGRMHYDGNSLGIDDVTAYMWFDIAATNGLSAGVRYREGIARRMSDEDITTARQRAENWRTTHPLPTE